jgi:glyoxylase-like metal-dependent hydrolase (beta-lactamase superfamily II)
MGLVIERYGEVTRLRMTSVGSRAVGMDVSAYVFRGAMIDTGFYRARHELLNALQSLDVRGAILTHWHEDHAGNAAVLAGEGLPLSMRADTQAMLRSGPNIELYRRVVWGRPPALGNGSAAFDHALECIHTPGHSTDHQVVWDAETRTLFSGDLWLGVRSKIFHSSENPYEIVESLRRARALEPERMFDAHRGFVENPVAAIDARIEWLSEMIGTIERRIAEGWSDRRVLRRELGGEELAGYVSYGNYSRMNLVLAVRRRVEMDVF